jgi:outer membrane protein assembly factor BamB
VYALDKATGRLLWKFATKGPIQAHARLADGAVFVGSGDHKLYALDAKTGRQRWAFAMPMHEQARPAVADGMVYFGAWDNTFYALDAETGAVKWTHKTTGPNLMYSPAISSPCAMDGKVIFTYPVPGDQPDAPQVLCVDGKTGANLWGYRPPESTSSDSSPTSDGTNVYLCTIKGEAYALDLATGRRVWTSPLEGGVNDGSAVVHDGQVICNTLLGGVEGHDAKTGVRLWSWKTGDGFEFSWPTVAGDTAYQTSFDGTLSAIRLPPGRP